MLISEPEVGRVPSIYPTHLSLFRIFAIMGNARKCCCTPEPYKHLLYLAFYLERVSPVCTLPDDSIF